MIRRIRSSALKYARPLLLEAVAATAAAAADPADGPFTEESKLENAQAGFHRLKIGKIEVTALSDGTAGFFVLNVLAEPTRAEAENLDGPNRGSSSRLMRRSMPSLIRPSLAATVLVDAGTGGLVRTEASLAAG